MSKKESKCNGGGYCGRNKGKIERGIKTQKNQAEFKVATEIPSIGYMGHEIKPRKDF